MKIIIPGVPVPKARPRSFATRRDGKVARVGDVVAGKRSITPTETRQYERLVAGMALVARQEARERLWTGPVNMEIRIYPDRVEVLAVEMDGEARTSGFDLDNVVKSIKDGMEGVLYRNDRQVEYLTVKLIK